MSRSACEFSGQLVSSRYTLTRPTRERHSWQETLREPTGTLILRRVPSCASTASTGRSRASASRLAACCTPSLSTDWMK